MKVLVVTALFIMTWSSLSLACGSILNGLVPGDKVLGIQLSEGMDNSEGHGKIALDDDGMLAVGIAAAYCNQDLTEPRVELTSSQSACIDKAQSSANISYSSRIYSTYFGDGKDDALLIIKSECNIDLKRMYADAKAALDKQPLACIPKVKGLVKKAAARFHEYAQAMTNPQFLATLNASDSAKAELVSNAQKEEASLNELVTLMNKSPLTRKDWEPWLKNYMTLIPNESFRVVNSMSEAGSANPEMRSEEEILISMNAALPGLIRSRCGFPISSEAIDKLSAAEWRPLSDSRQGGNPNATHE